MQSLLARLAACAAVLAIAATPAVAGNGQMPRSQLAPIYHPSLHLVLDREAAAALNTLELRLAATAHPLIYPGGADSAYRTYARQVYWRHFWCALKRCVNAAIPGTSNHGLGLAIDLATPAMRRTLDVFGAPLGWAKRWSDAAQEWWHIRYRPGVWRPRPDPGPDPGFPLLAEGSGGLGQSYYVRIVQRRLRLHLGSKRIRVDGDYGPQIRKAVLRFQALRGLPADGRVGERTWRALKRGISTPITTPLPPPATPPVVPAPTPVVVNGPDVSYAQGSIDFAAVRAAGYEFVIQKSSEGGDYRDPTFTPARVHAIHAAGLVLGVYHFLRPRAGRRGADEARFFVRTARAAGWGHGDLPLVADLEQTTLSPAATIAYWHSFVSEVRRLTGRRAMTYTGPGFWKYKLGDPRRNYGTPLWVAHYGARQPTVPSAWKGRYSLWQYTDKATIPGIAPRVDLSVVPGGVEELNRLRAIQAPRPR